MACSTGMTAVLCKYNDYKCQKKKRLRNCLCKYYIYNRVTTEISQKHEKSIDFSILV